MDGVKYPQVSPKSLNREFYSALFFTDTVEKLAAAQEELVAGQGRGCVQSVIEFIGGQRFQFLAVLENQRGTVASGNIYLSGGGYRGTVDIGQTLKSFSVNVGLAGFGVGTGE